MHLPLRIILIVYLLSTPIHAVADEWTTSDTIFQASYLTMHIIDWGQSLHTAKNPDKFREENTILGDTPTTGAVNTYFALTAAGHTIISYLLPQPYRRYWQYLTIGLETTVIAANYNIGVKIDF